jgi:hypothetical protein
VIKITHPAGVAIAPGSEIPLATMGPRLRLVVTRILYTNDNGNGTATTAADYEMLMDLRQLDGGISSGLHS